MPELAYLCRKKNMFKDSSFLKNLVIAFIVFAAVIACILSLMFGVPRYIVWQQEQSGMASLAKAAQTRQILITQAEAERDAARARADAIAIMGEAAQKYPEYRQQEFVAAFAEALKEGNIQQLVYVPTEAMIPIMEKNRLDKK